MIDYEFTNAVVKKVVGSFKSNYTSLRKMLTELLLWLHVPFYDECCPVEGNPLPVGVINNNLSYYNSFEWVNYSLVNTTIVDIDVTNINNYIENNLFIVGQSYRILNVHPPLYGGTDVYLLALETDVLSHSGVGVFYEPTYDKTKKDLGIWNNYSSWRILNITGRFPADALVTTNTGATANLAAGTYLDNKFTVVSGDFTNPAITSISYVTPTAITATGTTNTGTLVTVNSTAQLLVDMLVTVTSGTGAFPAGTKVTNIISATQFYVNAAPTTPLTAGAVIQGSAAADVRLIQVKSYPIATRVIWGGKYWLNLTGNVGSAVDVLNLDTTNWQVVPYSATEYNVIYDTVEVDLPNNIIVMRQDLNGNKVVTAKNDIDFFLAKAYSSSYNHPINVTQWGNPLSENVIAETITGTATSTALTATNTITVNSTDQLKVGMTVSVTGIGAFPANTTITSILSTTQFTTLNNPLTLRVIISGGISTTLVTLASGYSTTNLLPGMLISLVTGTGTGTFVAGTTIASILSPTEFTLSVAPSVAISVGATIQGIARIQVSDVINATITNNYTFGCTNNQVNGGYAESVNHIGLFQDNTVESRSAIQGNKVQYAIIKTNVLSDNSEIRLNTLTDNASIQGNIAEGTSLINSNLIATSSGIWNNTLKTLSEILRNSLYYTGFIAYNSLQNRSSINNNVLYGIYAQIRNNNIFVLGTINSNVMNTWTFIMGNSFYNAIYSTALTSSINGNVLSTTGTSASGANIVRNNLYSISKINNNIMSVNNTNIICNTLDTAQGIQYSLISLNTLSVNGALIMGCRFKSGQLTNTIISTSSMNLNSLELDRIIYDSLSTVVSTPVRVINLGPAEGYYSFTKTFNNTAGSGLVGKLTIPYFLIPTGYFLSEVMVDVGTGLTAGAGAYITLGIEVDALTAGLDITSGLVTTLNSSGITRIPYPTPTRATVNRALELSVAGAAITGGTIGVFVRINKLV